MKNIILAAMLAVSTAGASVSFAPVADAATMVIKTDSHRSHMRRHHHRVHCFTKKVRKYRHHRLVVKYIRVCR